MINTKDITFTTIFTRLDQRVLDVIVEKHLFKRFIVHKPEGVDLDKLKTYRGLVSFVEPNHFENLKERYKEFSPRLVPSYTRAEEPCIHLIKPKLQSMSFVTATTRSQGFTSTHIIKQGHKKAKTEAVHKIPMISLVVASIKLVLSEHEFQEQYKKYTLLIKRT